MSAIRCDPKNRKKKEKESAFGATDFGHTVDLAISSSELVNPWKSTEKRKSPLQQGSRAALLLSTDTQSTGDPCARLWRMKENSLERCPWVGPRRLLLGGAWDTHRLVLWAGPGVLWAGPGTLVSEI